MVHIEALIDLQCCNLTIGLSPIERDIDPTRGGSELTRINCHTCGSEYMFGVIARTREQSLADEAFEHVNDEVLDEIGVDREDYDAPADEVRMCARCDGTAEAMDLCNGCREYIHAACRLLVPLRAARHAVEEHWAAPKVPMVDALDDGSVMTGDDAIDFVAEAED